MRIRCFVLVVNGFWYWFGLVWRSVCKKGNVWFSNEMRLKICQNPCSCFSYRLSYNKANKVIKIGK